MTTDTRSPEQVREDAYNLAYVQRRAAQEGAQSPRATPTFVPEPDPGADAYEAGYIAGLAGWSVRGTAGMESHERGCDKAHARGFGAQWRDGYKAGSEARETSR